METKNKEKLKFDLQNETSIENREINKLLSLVWEKTQNEKDFLNFLQSPAFLHKHILSLMGINRYIPENILADKKNLLNDLNESEKKIFKKGLEKYDFFGIVDDKDNNLYYSNGMPVVDYKTNCHIYNQKESLVKNFHRSSVWIIKNQSSQIFLSKRSMNKLVYKGYYEIGGGHCGLLSYDDTIKKELSEELSIDADNLNDVSIRPMYKLKIENLDNQNQITQVYEVVVSDNVANKINFADGEIASGKFYDAKEILEILKNNANIIPSQIVVLQNYFNLPNTIKQITILDNGKRKNIEKTTGDQLSKLLND